MTHPLPDAAIAEKNRIESPAAWLWLYDVYVNGGEFILRLVNNPTTVEFDSNDDDVLETYQPYPLTFEQFSEEARGNLSSVRVSAANMDRRMISFLERYNGLRDEAVTVHCVSSAHLDDPDARISCGFRIVQATATEQSVVFELSAHPFLDLDFPMRKFSRNTCPFIFGSRECGWGFLEDVPGINPPAGVVPSFSCDKSLNGPNGCRFHGGLYEAAGVDPIHPKRFGGHPLIPRRRGP